MAAKTYEFDFTKELDEARKRQKNPKKVPVVQLLDDDSDEAQRLSFDERGNRRSTDPKQIRKRMRKHAKLAAMDFEELYKPLEEWDEEELARGRPRAKDGSFRGKTPQWVTREIQEKSLQRFVEITQTKIRSTANIGLATIAAMLEDDRVDDKGKPLVSYSTKLDAAKFLVEHVVGKPKQRVEQDISVKMQGMLAAAVITPGRPQATISETVAQAEIEEAESWEVLAPGTTTPEMERQAAIQRAREEDEIEDAEWYDE